MTSQANLARSERVVEPCKEEENWRAHPNRPGQSEQTNHRRRRRTGGRRTFHRPTMSKSTCDRVRACSLGGRHTMRDHESHGPKLKPQAPNLKSRASNPKSRELAEHPEFTNEANASHVAGNAKPALFSGIPALNADERALDNVAGFAKTKPARASRGAIQRHDGFTPPCAISRHVCRSTQEQEKPDRHRPRRGHFQRRVGVRQRSALADRSAVGECGQGSQGRALAAAASSTSRSA